MAKAADGVPMTILVTGIAGFIGMHVADALLRRGETVVGVDDLNASYDPSLKEARLRHLGRYAGLRVRHGDLADAAVTAALADELGGAVTAVVHLAAHVAPPWSVRAPGDRIRRRLEHHLAVLDLCRDRLLPGLKHLLYAVPEHDPVAGPPACIPGGAEDPVEQTLSRGYARCHGLPQTMLRLGSIYGPWGRPDMDYFIIADAIDARRPVILPEPDPGRPVPLHVDAAVAAVLAAIDRPPTLEGDGLHRAIEIAAAERMPVERLVKAIEETSGRTARRLRVPVDAGGDMQGSEPVPGQPDPPSTIDPSAAIGLEEGVARFVAWHREWLAMAAVDRRQPPA